MATEKDKKGKKPYKTPIRNANMIGGHHPGKGKDEVKAEGRASYTRTVDSKLGTNHSKNVEAYKDKVKHIVPGELGSSSKTPPANPTQPQRSAAKNSWAKQVEAKKSVTPAKPAQAQPSQTKQNNIDKKPAAKNSWAQRVEAQRAALQTQTASKQAVPKKQQAAQTQAPQKNSWVQRVEAQKQAPKPAPAAKAKQPTKTPTKGR